MNAREKTVCFTGHRNYYDPAKEIADRLQAAVKKSISEGFTEYIAGGAIRFDTVAAWTVIRLREEYPQIRLILALPCPPQEQTLKWTADQKAEYQEIFKLADEVKILSDKYTSSCMLDRNRYMVDNSSRLICYLRSTSARGGTKYTVNYAQQQRGLEIIKL